MILKFRAWYTPFKGEEFGQEMKYGQAGSLLTHAEMSPVSVSDGFNHLDHEKAVVQASECHSGLVCKLVDLDLEYRIYYDPVFHTDYEVIGNIYENKELLEVE